MIHDLADHTLAHVLGVPSGVISLRLFHHATVAIKARLQMAAYANEIEEVSR